MDKQTDGRTGKMHNAAYRKHDRIMNNSKQQINYRTYNTTHWPEKRQQKSV